MIIKFAQIFLFCLTTFTAFGQFGIRASYNLNEAKAWDNFFSDALGRSEDIFSSSMTLSVDYWLRLPNLRIEFYPNISYHQASTTIPNALVGNGDLDLGLRQMGLGIYTHVYLLDMIGDCDCPTFSKQGGLMKKGFFILAEIGADYSQKNAANLGFTDGNIDFKAAVGLGLDIGVTDLLTVSPFIQYRFYPAVSWHELGPIFSLPDNNVEANLSQIQLGVRVGFRPDYR